MAMFALISDIASRSGSSEPCCRLISDWLSPRLRGVGLFCFLATATSFASSLQAYLCILLATSLADRRVLLRGRLRDGASPAGVHDDLRVDPALHVHVDPRALLIALGGFGDPLETPGQVAHALGEALH